MTIIVFNSLSGQNIAINNESQTPIVTENASKNNIYVSFGSTLVYSAFTICYERNVFNKPNSEWNIRGGWGFNAALWGVVCHHFLVDMCYIGGKSNHHFEACLGVSMLFDMGYYLYYKNDPNLYEPFSYFADWYPSAYVGYRYKKPGGKFLFRVGVGWPEQAGFGVGFCF